MRVTAWLPIAISIGALLLSAYNSYNIYTQRRDKRPRLKVRARVNPECEFDGKQDPETGEVTGNKEAGVVVNMQNIGERDYTVKSYSFKPLFGKRFVLFSSIPSKLVPEARKLVEFKVRDVLSGAGVKPRRRLLGRLEVQDAMERRYRSQFLFVKAKLTPSPNRISEPAPQETSDFPER